MDLELAAAGLADIAPDIFAAGAWPRLGTSQISLIDLGRDIVKTIAEYVAAESDHAALRLVCRMFNEVSQEVIKARAPAVPIREIDDMVRNNRTFTIRDSIIKPWVYLGIAGTSARTTIIATVYALLSKICEWFFKQSIVVPYKLYWALDIDVPASYYDDIITKQPLYGLWKQLMFTCIINGRLEFSVYKYFVSIFGTRSQKMISDIKLVEFLKMSCDPHMNIFDFIEAGLSRRWTAFTSKCAIKTLSTPASRVVNAAYNTLILAQYNNHEFFIESCHGWNMTPREMDFLFPRIIKYGRMMDFLNTCWFSVCDTWKDVRDWFLARYPDGSMSEYVDFASDLIESD
jgi:hypothetical protein